MAGTDALEDLLTEVDDFALVVEGPQRAHVVAAVRAAAAALSRLPATALATAPWVSAPAPLPQGPAVRINDLSTRTEIRRRAAGVIRATLEDHGVDPFTATVVPVDGLDDLDRCPRAVVLRLYPAPACAAGVIEPTWIDVASEWVFGGLGPGSSIRMRILGVEVDVDVADAAGVLHGCARARTWCDVLSGDVGTRIRTASLSFGESPHVAVGAGGPRCDDEGLLARFELLQEVATELAGEVAYAGADFEETFAGLGTGMAGSEWTARGGAPAHVVAGRLVDRFVPEAFPFQVLGPGHIDRLRAADSTTVVGDEVADGRWALTIGEPVDWLPGAERSDARAGAWERLHPLLLGIDDLDEADARTGGDQGSDGAEALRPADDELGVPDLDDVVIEVSVHPRRGRHLTVLELAAWLAGESHSDAPRSVAPVVATFARHLSAGLGDERRQRLRHVAGDLVGSAPPDARLETRRAWLVVHWMIARHAGAWLRSAGLVGTADRLARVPWPLDDTELVRAIELLGSAITTAGRRGEIARSMAGDEHGEAIEELAWEAWEHAAERTGWVAATEAIGRDLPPDLVYGVDQRVIDGSRDPRGRAELEESRRSLGDAAWSAALHEMATAAWRSAWEEMEAYVHHESTFSIRTTIRRSLEARLGTDADVMEVDGLLDDVDAVARETLARDLLAGEEVSGAWKRAVDAAQAVDGSGAAWCAALAETRRALGEVLYDDAIAIGEAELRRHLGEAPELVGRAVAAAIAREAAGVAGRSVAARAAAGAFAAGDGVAGARAGAARSLEPVIDELADDAIALLTALVDAEPPA